MKSLILAFMLLIGNQTMTEAPLPPAGQVITPDIAAPPPKEDRVYPDPKNYSHISNASRSWYFNRNAVNQPPSAQREIDLSIYNARYLGDVDSPVIYLTFDMGYENGYTAAILDILLEKEVHAAFFFTRHYILSSPELTRRIAEEGHLPAHHSSGHSDFPGLTATQIASDIWDLELLFWETAEASLAPFFRPPSGVYSERVLAVIKDLGYQTIFWSFAYQDWLTDQQPTREAALKMMVDNLHPGSIMLLHSVSKANAAALGDFIDTAKSLGYTFASLTDL